MTIPLDISIVCNLTDAKTAARREEIMSGLLSQVIERQELADGYAFRFPNTDEAAQELLAFILLERQCCPFFQLGLVFTPEKGPIWLHLRGGDGVKRFVETELVVSDEF